MKRLISNIFRVADFANSENSFIRGGYRLFTQSGGAGKFRSRDWSGVLLKKVRFTRFEFMHKTHGVEHAAKEAGC